MATDPSEIEGTASARSALAESEDALRDVLLVARMMRDRLLAEGEVTQPEVAKTVTALAQIRSRLNEEIARYEDRVLLLEKRVAHAPLDFDELRSVLGSKIDRIRTALDAGEVSEGPDG